MPPVASCSPRARSRVESCSVGQPHAYFNHLQGHSQNSIFTIRSASCVWKASFGMRVSPTTKSSISIRCTRLVVVGNVVVTVLVVVGNVVVTVLVVVGDGVVTVLVVVGNVVVTVLAVVGDIVVTVLVVVGDVVVLVVTVLAVVGDGVVTGLVVVGDVVVTGLVVREHQAVLVLQVPLEMFWERQSVDLGVESTGGIDGVWIVRFHFLRHALLQLQVAITAIVSIRVWSEDFIEVRVTAEHIVLSTTLGLTSAPVSLAL
ncbi:hypothetical protein B566_EDAN015376 [Ephemera danica]|nr:hypothetical protein B566_EDAN015376 [Ephemera danica]